MPAPSTNPKVDRHLAKVTRWGAELAALREIALGCGLSEELKWGHPCYTLGEKNVILLHGFKEYCAVLFFKGALLEDPRGLLVQQTKNVQAARQLRFTSLAEVTSRARALRAFVKQAVAVEKAGKAVPRKETGDFDVPAELEAAFRRAPALKRAFGALTPGRQRAYLLHFGGAKQSATRAARVEKHRARILAGKGLDD